MLEIKKHGCLEVMAAAVMGPWAQGVATASRILHYFQCAGYTKVPKTKGQDRKTAVRKFGLVFSATLCNTVNAEILPLNFSSIF